jgi:hypothetical protein
MDAMTTENPTCPLCGEPADVLCNLEEPAVCEKCCERSHDHPAPGNESL